MSETDWQEWDEGTDPDCTHDWRVPPDVFVRPANPPQHNVAVCADCNGRKWRSPPLYVSGDVRDWPKWKRDTWSPAGHTPEGA